MAAHRLTSAGTKSVSAALLLRKLEGTKGLEKRDGGIRRLAVFDNCRPRAAEAEAVSPRQPVLPLGVNHLLSLLTTVLSESMISRVESQLLQLLVRHQFATRLSVPALP